MQGSANLTQAMDIITVIMTMTALRQANAIKEIFRLDTSEEQGRQKASRLGKNQRELSFDVQCKLFSKDISLL